MTVSEQKKVKPIKQKTKTHTKKTKPTDAQQPINHVDEEAVTVSEINVKESYSYDTVSDSGISSAHRIQMPHKRTFFAGAIIIVVFIGGMFYFHWFGVGLTAQERTQIELQTAVTAVGKLMLLPKNETPVFAKIINAKKLAKQQQFFINAENGDELLLFQKSERAIIYSPARNIIVNVGPIQRPAKSKTVTSAQSSHI